MSALILSFQSFQCLALINLLTVLLAYVPEICFRAISDYTHVIVIVWDVAFPAWSRPKALIIHFG